MINKKFLNEYFRIYAPEETANNCCFICKKNIDGCSWSKNAEPVAGWKVRKESRRDAENIRRDDDAHCSFKIFYCPEFEEGDATEGREYDEDKCMDLLEAVYKNAADDYKSAYKRKLKLERRNAELFQNEIEIAECMMRECAFLLGKWTDKLKKIVEKELDSEDGDSDG